MKYIIFDNKYLDNNDMLNITLSYVKCLEALNLEIQYRASQVWMDSKFNNNQEELKHANYVGGNYE